MSVCFVRPQDVMLMLCLPGIFRSSISMVDAAGIVSLKDARSVVDSSSTDK